VLDVARYYIVVCAAGTTRCSVFSALMTCALVLASGACPEARQGAEISAEQRREAIVRMWRDAKPAPAPLVPAEPAWTLTLPMPPSAAGAMDDRRIYIPLRRDMLVALNRETGLVDWTRAIDTASPPVAAGGHLFVVSGNFIWALDAEDGTGKWAVPVDHAITAPLVFDSGWLIAIAEPGDVMALRAADGHLVWRRSLGASSSHPAVPGGPAALYFALADGRVVALALETGEPLWEQKLSGTISAPTVARDRVFVGSTDNFFYAFDDDSGRLEWKWRNGGDVIGAAADGDVVYFASLDNIMHAVNRGNGNQRWKKPTGTRPVLPPRAFGGIVMLPGLMPAVTVFVGETGAVMGTHAAAGNLVGAPLVDPVLKPFRVGLVTITREGVVEALRPAGIMFREAALVPIAILPGRPVARERIQ
jgi:outer membrane protein assembly factor BamB